MASVQLQNLYPFFSEHESQSDSEKPQIFFETKETLETLSKNSPSAKAALEQITIQELNPSNILFNSAIVVGIVAFGALHVATMLGAMGSAYSIPLIIGGILTGLSGGLALSGGFARMDAKVLIDEEAKQPLTNVEVEGYYQQDQEDIQKQIEKNGKELQEQIEKAEQKIQELSSQMATLQLLKNEQTS